MAGARVTFEVRLDDAAAQARLAGLVDRLDDRRGFLRNVGEHLLNSTRTASRPSRTRTAAPGSGCARRRSASASARGSRRSRS